jgi:hypothetical protein
MNVQMNVQIPEIIPVELKDSHGIPAGDVFVKKAIIEGLKFLNEHPEDSYYYQTTGDTLVTLHREDMETYHRKVSITVSTVRQYADIELP